MTAVNVKEKVVDKVSKAVKNVKVNAIRCMNDGGVRIETQSKADMLKIRESKAFECNGLVLAKAPRPTKKILLKFIPKEYKDAKVAAELMERNRDPDIPEKEFTEEVANVSRGTDTGNIVIRASDRVIAYWKATGGIDIFWRNHQIIELSGVEACFRCFALDHWARECPEKEQICKR